MGAPGFFMCGKKSGFWLYRRDYLPLILCRRCGLCWPKCRGGRCDQSVFPVAQPSAVAGAGHAAAGSAGATVGGLVADTGDRGGAGEAVGATPAAGQCSTVVSSGTGQWRGADRPAGTGRQDTGASGGRAVNPAGRRAAAASAASGRGPAAVGGRYRAVAGGSGSQGDLG